MSQDPNQKPKISIKGMANTLDALALKGLISQDQYNSIKFEAINANRKPEELAVEKQMISSTDLAKVQSEMRNIGYVDLLNIAIPVETLHTIESEVARANKAIVFEIQNNKVKVAMQDPLDLQRVKYLEGLIGKSVESYYAAESDINQIIDTRYGAQVGSEVDEALEEVNSVKLDTSSGYIGNDAIGTAPIIKIVNMALDYAIKNKASDIHIEPRDGKISVRFRIRGVLAEKLTLPKKLLSAVVTRIKILSNLKIDEKRIPQDGRFQVKTQGESVDVRVSIMPSIYGEKVVMRILEKSNKVLNIESTGIRGDGLERVKSALKKTQGIILVTGPTGSGKSTTLSTYLNMLNTPDVNIVTLEDPVEIRVDGTNQVQVNPEVGLTFASGLRSILRQDPDIIMVGEIRDKETAKLAVQAALVGRLVLSTIHTNSASGAFARLIDMEIEPFLLSSTVNIVIGQRLVRTLGDSKKPYAASKEVVAKLHEELDVFNGIDIMREDGTTFRFDKTTTEVTLYEPVPTPVSESGYDGRIGIFEVLKVSESISALINKRSSIQDIQAQAIKEGMITMAQDGFIKAMQGVTTIEEVLRVKNE